METQENYKLGNWVNWKSSKGEEHASLPINTGEKPIRIKSIKEKTINGHPLQEISPVPLTTDLLTKCGFEETASPYLYRHSLFPTFEVELSDRYSWHFYYKPAGASSLQLTGVHHLQNLFEQVTGYALNVAITE